jgi:hypothetical protein
MDEAADFGNPNANLYVGARWMSRGVILSLDTAVNQQRRQDTRITPSCQRALQITIILRHTATDLYEFIGEVFEA